MKLVSIFKLYSYKSLSGLFNMKILIREIYDNKFSTSIKFILKK